MTAFRRIRDAIATAALWFLVGFGSALLIAPRPPAPAPAPPSTKPAPAPEPIPAPVDTVRTHGHLTVSFIEPFYPSPAVATIRHDLAAYDWAGLDTMFRAYTHGQAELNTLGFTSHYAVSDLPIVFVQETLTNGSAPLVGAPIKPTSADQVINHVKGMRGQ